MVTKKKNAEEWTEWTPTHLSIAQIYPCLRYATAHIASELAQTVEKRKLEV